MGTDGSIMSMSQDRRYSGYDYRDGGWIRSRSRSHERRVVVKGGAVVRGGAGWNYNGERRYDRSKSHDKEL